MRISRRTFLGTATAAAAAFVPGRTASLQAAQDLPFGESRLGLSDTERDGLLYLPSRYRPGTPVPLVIMLHGLGGIGPAMRTLFTVAEARTIVVIAPESRNIKWGQEAAGFDADVRYIGAAFRYVTSLLDIDPEYVALAGQSDGAGYALSMGLAYGDTFNHLMVFAGGQMAPLRRRGKPRIFFGHGIDDAQMPIEETARVFVPALKKDGYDVTLLEYEGGHAVPQAVTAAAFDWLIAGRRG